MIRHVFAAFLIGILTVSAALAGERIALIVGNGSYSSVSSLDNPASDAQLMAETLQRVGFRVTMLVDASQSEMKRGISEFGRELRQAGTGATALFYYAGHAVQSFGNNYLLPVDSAIQHPADLDLYGVEADWILRQLFAARVETNIVILDACRNNPFASVQGFDEQGLAEMDAPTGSFIAYATAPGDVALDGAGSNSPYTSALAREILAGTSPIEQVFKSVRVSVLQETGGAQTPWDSSSLTSDFRFLQGATPSVKSSDGERKFWESVRESRDKDKLRFFVQIYPDSQFRSDAEEQIAALERGLVIANPKNPSTSDTTDAAAGPITFTSPLTQGAPEIVGRSIQNVFSTGSPLFSPIEGIPDELWKGQKCSNCHQWTKELLCEQGQFYLTAEGQPLLKKEHPLGGTFKENLSRWAADGCQG